MHAPRPVRGGTVGVFAPSSPFPPERYATGVRAIEAMGFQVVEHPALASERGYLAGDDPTRLRQIYDLLEDPAIDILWAARGGYGLHRIAAELDPERLARAAKPIVGFSDVCVLHWAAQRGGLISIHAPVVIQFGEVSDFDRETVRLALAGEIDRLIYEADGPAITAGVAEGRLIGGCLSVVAPLVGTGLFPSVEGAILLLEDVGEATYRIDRLLTQLRLAGLFSKVAGIALGDFIGCEPRNPKEQTILEVLTDRLGDLGVPVLAGLPFGHSRRNRALPLGARARLDAGARRLSVLGP